MAAGGPAEGEGLGAGQTASLVVGKGADLREQGAALGVVQGGQKVVEEGAVAVVAVPGEMTDVWSDEEQKLVKVLGFEAWSLM